MGFTSLYIQLIIAYVCAPTSCCSCTKSNDETFVISAGKFAVLIFRINIPYRRKWGRRTQNVDTLTSLWCYEPTGVAFFTNDNAISTVCSFRCQSTTAISFRLISYFSYSSLAHAFLILKHGNVSRKMHLCPFRFVRDVLFSVKFLQLVQVISIFSFQISLIYHFLFHEIL